MNSISESATMKVSSGKYWYQDVQVSILSPVIGRRLYVVMDLLCTGDMYVVYIMLITDSLAKVKKKKIKLDEYSWSGFITSLFSV